MKLLSAFSAIDGFQGVYSATRENLRCTAIRLRSGGLCLFSPVRGLGEQAIASLKGLGAVEILLAPNHWHNMGLHEYVKAFPEASLFASADAKARLEFITQLQFEGPAKLQRLLPRNIRLLRPSGLKTGEVWLSIGDARHHAWVVVDAFYGPKTKRGTSHEPDILGTFPKFGLADRGSYLTWIERQLRADRPTTIVPCHGSIVVDSRLPDKIRRLVASKL